MKINRIVLLCFSPIALSLFISYHHVALAAAKPTGITVSPAFQQVIISPIESSHPVSFRITNDKNEDQTLSLSGADFNTLNESGGLFFVGTNPTALQKKYGLAKWFNIPNNVITIGPKKTEVVNANIINLPDLSGGGHYGALMIRVGNAGVEEINSKKVSIDPIASSLLFVTKTGGDTHKLSLSNVDYKGSLFSIPKSVDLKFSNVGNTHLVPRGVVKILNQKGSTISQGTINLGSSIVLPESSRKLIVNLKLFSKATKPGKYKIEVDYRFDGIDQIRAYQTSFWHVPISYLSAAIFLLIALAFGGYRLLIKVRRHTS